MPSRSAAAHAPLRRRTSSYQKMKATASRVFQAAMSIVTPPSSPRHSPRRPPPPLLCDADALAAAGGAMRALLKAAERGEGDGWKLLRVQKKTGCRIYTKFVDGCTWTKGVGTLPLPPYVACAFLQDVESKRLYDVLFRRKCHVELVPGREARVERSTNDERSKTFEWIECTAACLSATIRYGTG